MKNQYFYLIVILVVLVIAVIGFSTFGSVGRMVCGPCGCYGEECSGPAPKYNWKCTDIKTYACPGNTTNYSCSSGVLSCKSCSESFVTEDYNVTLIAIGNQTINNTIYLSAVFHVNEESAILIAGQGKTLSDGTIFALTSLNLNYSSFYLQSLIETKSSSLTAPFPKSTTVNLKVSKIGESCGGTSFSCTNWYIPSCSGNSLKCTKTTYRCSAINPGNCINIGNC